MRVTAVVFGILLLCFPLGAAGADLYKVMVHNPRQADQLNAAGVEPIVRVSSGYLVLADPDVARNLEAAGIRLEFMAGGVEKNRMAMDHRLDRENVGKYPLIYEEDNLRIFQVSPDKISQLAAESSLGPIRNEGMRIVYQEERFPEMLRLGHGMDLQQLIALVEQDSLVSYTERLQAFRSRVTGTDSNYASSDWIAAKFVEFGYDSVAVDSFIEIIYGTTRICENVIAYKIGTVLPDHHIVVGAHRDAVTGSPGADDNGSGTAGVLEMARILKDIPTELTFVFILFDAEEQGLLGAYHYVEEASVRGDSIVYMLNMDMIAEEDNISTAKLFYGPEQTYTLLWQNLADSLVGINGVLSGNSGGSDHYPFIQYGYEATFVHEYVFSKVYHSSRDSTTYMNFEYMTRMVQASLATAYTVDDTYIPGPMLAISYPAGVPRELAPQTSTTFDVVVAGLNGGVTVPGSGQIHYTINDGAWQADPMTETSPDHYQATLPVLLCGEDIGFYISVEEATVGTITSPDPANPYRAFPVTGEREAFYDGFETDLGWSVSGGAWQRGTPTGGGGAHGSPDPIGGHESPTVIGYNLSGDYTNSMPERHLTSPAIDCSGLLGVRLNFRRWLGVEQPAYDHAYIRASTDGNTWITVWENLSEIADYAWEYIELDLSAVADNQSTVYLRWTMGTTDAAWVYCGWNIDDVTVTGYTCEQSPGRLTITTETLPDWTAGHPYSRQLTASGGFGSNSWSDMDGGLSGSGLALESSTGVLSGIPNGAGVVSFTARVTDIESRMDERPFSFTISEPVSILTTGLPACTLGNIYSRQLAASGGTGALSWSDRDGNLAGTGLVLSSDGWIVGMPTSAGLITFTARCTDAVGAFADRQLSVEVMTTFVCGDANGDGYVNIGDAVYLIAYVFKGGQAPDPLCLGDANGDGEANVGDAVYLVSYVFGNGPEPVESCCP